MAIARYYSNCAFQRNYNVATIEIEEIHEINSDPCASDEFLMRIIKFDILIHRSQLYEFVYSLHLK